ncbi:MAG: ATP-binding protein [Candidatus Micrarchaeia archaeon]
MDAKEITNILDSWNFWNRSLDTGIERAYYSKHIVDILSESEISIVIETGIRRAGKSFIARQVAKALIQRGIVKEDILIINLEDERLVERSYSLLLEMYSKYKERFGKTIKPIIILDEAQEVDGWERFVRGLTERGEAKFIITGSSSKLLDSEYSTLLSGRQVVVYIHPLNLPEYKKFTKGKKSISDYIEEGGFPAVVLSKNKQDIIKSYLDTIILKDVISRFNIQNNEELIRLAKFYITSIASRITFNSASKFLKLPVKTVYNFSAYLEKSYLLFFVKRFSFSIKAQDNSPRKVYSIDNSFPAMLGVNPIKIKGRLLENAIASTLYLISRHADSFSFYYWYENNKEVDFVIKDHNKYRLVQVAYSIKDEKTKERELSSLMDCTDRLNAEKLEVVSMDYEGEEMLNGRMISYIKAEDWIEKMLRKYSFL